MSEPKTRVIVGLGNPGAKYARNRHNIGFMVLDELARRLSVGFRTDAANYHWVAGADFALVKPLTYMNLSGEALAAWSADQGLPLGGRPVAPADSELNVTDESSDSMDLAALQPSADVIAPLIVCDDLALPLGSVRLRARGSSGGQNGLASVIEHLGGEEIPRMRLGIAPIDVPVAAADWPDYVLSDFAEKESEAVADLVDHAVAALVHWLENDWETTISKFNRRIRPLDS